MLKRILSLSVKEFIHLLNDWWLPSWMLFGGVIELLAVGWATSRPMTNLPLMVLDQDRSGASRAVITAKEARRSVSSALLPLDSASKALYDFRLNERSFRKGEITNGQRLTLCG